VTVNPVAAPDVDLANLDISDMSLWQDDPPYELFARIRKEDPIHWSELRDWPQEQGFWSITRWDDMRAVSLDHETFSSETGAVFMLDDIGVPLDILRLQPICMDPPRHDRIKALFQTAFTPKRIAEHEKAIRDIVNLAIDGVIEQGSCDLVEDVGQKVVTRVIGSLLGSPPEDDHLMVKWSRITVGFEDKDLRPNWEDAQNMLVEAMQYSLPQWEMRRETPLDDLASALVHAEIDGDKFNDFELLAITGLLGTAGSDSTRAVFTNSMRALMEHPDQMRMLIDDPSLIEKAREECLRCFPAFAYFRRTATKNTELGGKQIKEGDKIVMWYIASNRDETKFQNPEQFDIMRPETEHQAFGAGGRHFCLGAALARLELKILIEETLRRMPDVHIAGDPVRAESLFLNQLKKLPVEFTPGQRELS
jgi:cytochrome P450